MNIWLLLTSSQLFISWIIEAYNIEMIIRSALMMVEKNRRPSHNSRLNRLGGPVEDDKKRYIGPVKMASE